MIAYQRMAETIKSIRDMNIPEYEIFIIGGEGNKFTGNLKNVTKVDFDESIKRAWITKKKNDVIKLCKYENVVMMHDYFVFHSNWYTHYDRFLKDNSYDICCNPIIMINGIRDYTDWVTWDFPGLEKQTVLPYHDWTKTKGQYISGGYFIVRKQFMIENPLNEELVAGDEEDIEWSKRVRDEAKIICNPSSYVRHNKPHRNQTISFWDKLL